MRNFIKTIVSALGQDGTLRAIQNKPVHPEGYEFIDDLEAELRVLDTNRFAKNGVKALRNAAHELALDGSTAVEARIDMDLPLWTPAMRDPRYVQTYGSRPPLTVFLDELRWNSEVLERHGLKTEWREDSKEISRVLTFSLDAPEGTLGSLLRERAEKRLDAGTPDLG